MIDEKARFDLISARAFLEKAHEKLDGIFGLSVERQIGVNELVIDVEEILEKLEKIGMK